MFGRKKKREAAPMDRKIWQEFYCNDCDGYFRVKLNVAINENIRAVCPNCGREHPRYIKAGVIFDGRNGGGREVEIIVPRSAYSKEPFNKASRANQRGGTIISKPSDINDRHPAADAIIKERWAELHGGRT